MRVGIKFKYGKIIEPRRRPLRTRMLARILCMLRRKAISVFSSHMNKNDYVSMLSRELIN